MVGFKKKKTSDGLVTWSLQRQYLKNIQLHFFLKLVIIFLSAKKKLLKMIKKYETFN